MEVKELEQIGVSFDDNAAFNLLGKLYAAAFRKVLSTLTKKLERQDIISALEDFFENLRLSFNAEYDEGFLKLLTLETENTPSFIFYGAHFGAEPILYLAGLHPILKKRVRNTNDKQVSVKLFGTDMFAKFTPETIYKFIIPIVVRDSPGQEIICQKEFLNIRRQNRGLLNDLAIKLASDFLIKGGNSLIIFPQGADKRSDSRWKTGIIRILENIINSDLKISGNIYLVPVQSPALLINWLFLRKVICKISKPTDKELKIVFGKPRSVMEFMADFPSREENLEIVKKQMNNKARLLQRNYKAAFE